MGFITPSQENMVVTRYSELLLTCQAPQSTPPAQFFWGDAPTDDGLVGVALDGRLVVSSFQGLDIYSCTVSNPVSSQSAASSSYRVADSAGQCV